jgi:hypothetical protein
MRANRYHPKFVISGLFTASSRPRGCRFGRRMDYLCHAHNNRGDANGERPDKQFQVLEAHLPKQGEELGDADVNERGQEVAKNQVAELREGRLDGVVFQYGRCTLDEGTRIVSNDEAVRVVVDSRNDESLRKIR